MSNKLNVRENAIRAAAVIDTDGSIYINRRKQGDRSDFTLTCKVSMTTPQIPQWFLKTYGGHLYERTPTGLGNKMVYEWNIQSKKADCFLHEIYPFLLVKQKQAKVGILLRKTQGTGIKIPMWEKQRIWQDRWMEMKNLNGKYISVFQLEEWE